MFSKREEKRRHLVMERQKCPCQLMPAITKCEMLSRPSYIKLKQKERHGDKKERERGRERSERKKERKREREREGD